MMIRRIVASLAVVAAMTMGSMATASSAEAAMPRKGPWFSMSECQDAQWRDIQAHPTWYFSGCQGMGWGGGVVAYGYYYSPK